MAREGTVNTPFKFMRLVNVAEDDRKLGRENSGLGTREREREREGERKTESPCVTGLVLVRVLVLVLDSVNSSSSAFARWVNNIVTLKTAWAYRDHNKTEWFFGSNLGEDWHALIGADCLELVAAAALQGASLAI